MNPFLLRPRERLADWKAFRKSLAPMQEEQQLLETSRYWGQAPTFTKSYDIEAPRAWTTPWEMIVANRWCRFSLAIGMEFTLRLSGWDPSRLSLKFIVDYDLGNTFFVVEVDGLYWLNHEYRTIVPVGGCYDVLCGWTFDGREYQPIVLDTLGIAA